MILESARLQEGDLDVWDQNERFDSMWASLPDLDRRVSQSVRALERFLSIDQTGYIGTSWGKDSVCALHIMTRLPRKLWLPVVWVKIKQTHNPESLKVRDVMLSMFDFEYHEIEVEWMDEQRDAWKDHFARGQSRSLEQSFNRVHGAGFDEAVKLFGDRHVSGVRAEESTVRTFRCRKFGHNSKKTSAPLAWWDSRDVFAYMFREHLPVNATYAMTAGGIIPRDRLRVDSLGGAKGSGTGIGRGRWEGTYFPDVMERIYQETLLAC